jgi:hypothetical protein|tara:strand:+ start:54 stop:332 length:279 start_codon:yes stop_codon:yes gene_type:complete
MGELANYTIDQVAGALALTLGSLGGLCLILFKSRCSTITICWGLWSCNRKVMTEEELEKAEKDKKEAEKKKADEMVSLVKPTTSTEDIESAV